MGHYDISTLDIDTIKVGRVTNIVRSILLENLANTLFFFLRETFFISDHFCDLVFFHLISVPAVCLNTPVNGMIGLFHSSMSRPLSLFRLTVLNP